MAYLCQNNRALLLTGLDYLFICLFLTFIFIFLIYNFKKIFFFFLFFCFFSLKTQIHKEERQRSVSWFTSQVIILAGTEPVWSHGLLPGFLCRLNVPRFWVILRFHKQTAGWKGTTKTQIHAHGAVEASSCPGLCTQWESLKRLLAFHRLSSGCCSHLKCEPVRGGLNSSLKKSHWNVKSK